MHRKIQNNNEILEMRLYGIEKKFGHPFAKQGTAEPAYSRLQGNKKYCLLKEKSTMTGIEKKINKGQGN